MTLLLTNFLDTIKNTRVSISEWIMGFLGIVFVRFIFEYISSPASDGIMPLDPHTTIHYILFLLSVSLCSILLVGYFNKDYKNAPKILLFGLPILWLAPIADLVFSGGVGSKMTYIFSTNWEILTNFVTFLGTTSNIGVTSGMRFGIALMILGFGCYLWINKNGYKRIALGMFSLYLLIFIIGSTPGIINTVSNIFTSTNENSLVFFEKVIFESTISHNTWREGVSSVSYARFFELGFNKILTQILFIISVISASLLFYRIDKNKFIAVIRNLRLERVNFYTLSLLSGMGFAYLNNPMIISNIMWVDFIGVVCLLMAWVGLWMNAVHTNDIADVEIDKISNTNRPLIEKTLTVEEMREVGRLWLIIGLLGAWAAGFYPFFMSLVYIAASYIYSVPPLRLRRFPIISSFLIGVACLATILAGYFFISPLKQISAFPSLLALGIVLMVTMAINFKDIKDVAGDRANGIMTIPTLFGERGIKIVAYCFALSILLVPVFLSFYLLYIIALPSALIGYRLIMKKPYQEKPIFVLRFVFLTGIAISYLILYYFVYIKGII
ncbi:MAG: UbiA family prenyltransferase [Patescibacteria group bacterium]